MHIIRHTSNVTRCTGTSCDSPHTPYVTRHASHVTSHRYQYVTFHATNTSHGTSYAIHLTYVMRRTRTTVLLVLYYCITALLHYCCTTVVPNIVRIMFVMHNTTGYLTIETINGPWECSSGKANMHIWQKSGVGEVSWSEVRWGRRRTLRPEGSQKWAATVLHPYQVWSKKKKTKTTKTLPTWCSLARMVESRASRAGAKTAWNQPWKSKCCFTVYAPSPAQRYSASYANTWGLHDVCTSTYKCTSTDTCTPKTVRAEVQGSRWEAGGISFGPRVTQSWSQRRQFCAASKKTEGPIAVEKLNYTTTSSLKSESHNDQRKESGTSIYNVQHHEYPTSWIPATPTYIDSYTACINARLRQ